MKYSFILFMLSLSISVHAQTRNVTSGGGGGGPESVEEMIKDKKFEAGLMLASPKEMECLTPSPSYEGLVQWSKLMMGIPESQLKEEEKKKDEEKINQRFKNIH